MSGPPAKAQVLVEVLRHRFVKPDPATHPADCFGTRGRWTRHATHSSLHAAGTIPIAPTKKNQGALTNGDVELAPSTKAAVFGHKQIDKQIK